MGGIKKERKMMGRNLTYNHVMVFRKRTLIKWLNDYMVFLYIYSPSMFFSSFFVFHYISIVVFSILGIAILKS